MKGKVKVMKAKSISYIRNMLIDETKKAEDAYSLFREKLIDKYKTDWINSEANETEKELLNHLDEKRDVLREVLRDFEEHQW